MNRSLGIVFIVIGIVLLIYGFDAMDSVSSAFSRIFNGAPSNKSIMLLFSGTVITVCGAISYFGGRE